MPQEINSDDSQEESVALELSPEAKSHINERYALNRGLLSILEALLGTHQFFDLSEAFEFYLNESKKISDQYPASDHFLDDVDSIPFPSSQKEPDIPVKPAFSQPSPIIQASPNANDPSNMSPSMHRFAPKIPSLLSGAVRESLHTSVNGAKKRAFVHSSPPHSPSRAQEKENRINSDTCAGPAFKKPASFSGGQ